MAATRIILILEDNDERIAAFQRTTVTLGYGIEVKVWKDAPSMMAECGTFFPTAALISRIAFTRCTLSCGSPAGWRITSARWVRIGLRLHGYAALASCLPSIQTLGVRSCPPIAQLASNA